MKTLSETILEVQPKKTIKIELFRGARYKIFAYDQDSKKDNAYFVAEVTEKDAGQEYKVK